MHPLRKKSHLDDIIPPLRVFRICRKKRKPALDYALKKSILAELGLKPPRGDKDVAREPFILLGYGINAFFDIMYALMWMFLTITVFLLPVYYLYSHNPTLGLKKLDPAKYSMNKFSLGNLGGTLTECFSKRVGKES